MCDGDVILSVCALGGFSAANNLCGYTKRFALGDDGFGSFGIAIDFHAMPHIVDTEHFLVAGGTSFLNGFEDRRDRQKVVFDMMHASAEADTLCLAAARAVNHAADIASIFSEQLFDDGSVGTGRTE